MRTVRVQGAQRQLAPVPVLPSRGGGRTTGHPPVLYRTDHLLAATALSRKQHFAALVAMLDRVQRFAGELDLRLSSG